MKSDSLCLGYANNMGYSEHVLSFGESEILVGARQRTPTWPALSWVSNGLCWGETSYSCCCIFHSWIRVCSVGPSGEAESTWKPAQGLALILCLLPLESDLSLLCCHDNLSGEPCNKSEPCNKT